MGSDFEECVAYQFEFSASGTYDAQWNRSFGQWSAANERQVGRWEVVGDMLRCKTHAGPSAADGVVQYAPAGRVFELPIASVLAGNSQSDDTPPPWEYGVRGAPVPLVTMKSEKDNADGPVAPPRASDAHFVFVDGELHEVSADIVDNYAECEWQRLMSCRIRFGLS